MADSEVTKGKIGKEDLRLYDGVSPTFNRETSTGGTATYNKVNSGDVDVLQVYGNGSTKTDACVNAALNVIGSKSATIRLTPGAWAFTNAVTIPSNITLKIDSGAVIDGAGTLTVNGEIISGLEKIFGSSITVAGLTVSYPEWWDIDGTSDEVQIIAAITAIATAGGTVILSKNAYSTSAVITSTKNYIYLDAKKSTTITLAANSDSSMILLSGTNCTVDGGIWDGNKANQSSGDAVIDLRGNYSTVTENTEVKNGYTIGINSNGADYVSVAGGIVKDYNTYGIMILNTTNFSVTGTQIDNGLKAIYVHHSDLAIDELNGSISGCNIDNQTESGIMLAGSVAQVCADYISISGNSFGSSVVNPLDTSLLNGATFGEHINCIGNPGLIKESTEYDVLNLKRFIYRGVKTASPNTTFTAGIGSTCINYAGGNATTYYAKESGDNTNTGWVGSGGESSVGLIISWATDTVPSGYLECDGSTISRTTYANLFTAVSDLYGIGDGSSTFEIPDLRGKFLRGWDHGAGTDPDAASRTDSGDGSTTGDHVGTNQDDGIKEHEHSLTGRIGAGTDPDFPYLQNSGSSTNSFDAVASFGGNETRPINVNVMHCIKY